MEGFKMKKIEAYIRPEKLEDVKAIVDKNKLNGMSITQIMGCGNQKGWKEIVRGTEVDFNFLQKIKIELVVLDEQIDNVVQSIVDELYTGEFGDGKIFIYDVADAIRVRTKERGDAAIK
jgi:nitrogen regulatory protein P-II 1